MSARRQDERVAGRPAAPIRWRIARGVMAGILLVSCPVACAAARLEVRPLRQEVDVRLDPPASRLAGRTVTELEVLGPAGDAGAVRFFELELHPELTVESVAAEGAVIVEHEVRPPEAEEEDEDGIRPVIHRLVVRDAGPRLRVEMNYGGKLWQDVAAGEVPGALHNFTVQAHIGERGVYLEPDGYWYPRLRLPDDADPDHSLADYTLVADPVEGFELVAGLEAVDPGDGDGDGGDGRLRWRSPFPLDGLVLLGGPLERHSAVHDGIALHAVLAPGKAAVAKDILAASAEYLDRYRPLIGPYPFREFTVLEAFFSSGFAFPTCTQIAGSQLSEHRQYRRHGYLDHELLHNWWGNGVLVDPGDGNWCEGLASYMGNYAGHVLDGDAEAARKQRRNYSNFLSSLPPEEDKPLGTFGLDDGAGRDIGYQKGAAVFHMLARKIGTDSFHAGLRLLTAEQMGRHIGWETIRAAMERASGADLAVFFDQWVRRGGAPRLRMTAAEWAPGAGRVLVTLDQGGTDFELEVPLRLHYGDRRVDELVTLDGSTQRVEVPCETEGLTAVELDPDYHLFRKLEPEQTMPTSSLTRRSERLVIVLPDGETAEPYRTVADSFRRAVLEDEEEPEPGHEVVERTASSLDPAELAEASVLVLGAAARAPALADFLGRTRSPVRFAEASFSVGGNEYGAPGEAVLVTVHHPDRPELGVTVYYGNSERALSNARVLTFYANSLLVFDTPEGEEAADASGMPRASVVERIDFEYHDRIEFSSAAR